MDPVSASGRREVWPHRPRLRGGCESLSQVLARKGWPLMMPATVVIPRVGSFALASFGRIRKVHEVPFGGSAGRKSFALKRIFEVVLVMGATDLTRAYVRWARKDMRSGSTR